MSEFELDDLFEGERRERPRRSSDHRSGHGQSSHGRREGDGIEGPLEDILEEVTGEDW
jgi:hypothetical protein